MAKAKVITRVRISTRIRKIAARLSRSYNTTVIAFGDEYGGVNLSTLDKMFCREIGSTTRLYWNWVDSHPATRMRGWVKACPRQERLARKTEIVQVAE